MARCPRCERRGGGGLVGGGARGCYAAGERPGAVPLPSKPLVVPLKPLVVLAESGAFQDPFLIAGGETLIQLFQAEDRLSVQRRRAGEGAKFSIRLFSRVPQVADRLGHPLNFLPMQALLFFGLVAGLHLR